MGDSMPFVLEKGPVWAFYDQAFSPGGIVGNRAARIRLLNRLRAPGDAEKGDAADEGRLEDGDPHDWGRRFIQASAGSPEFRAIMPQLMADHIRRDWFRGGAAPPDQGWVNWLTNPAEIVCRGFVRALEMSLQIDHVDLDRNVDVDTEPVPEVGADGGPCLPIEFWWSCPHPVFQLWVAKRPHPVAGDGLVTVTFTTPAPAWSYLAKCASKDGEYIDEAGVKQFGPLGLVHEHGRGRAQLGGKNAAAKALVFVGDDCVETRCWVVSPPDVFGLGPGERANGGQDLAPAGPAGNKHEMFAYPMLEGDGNIVTVSPFNDVGGYAEQRPLGR